MLSTYLAYVALFVLTENLYVVEFPDLEGCLTQGSTFEEALIRAQEALAIYYQENEGHLPTATKFEAILKRVRDPNTIVQLVVIDVNNYVARKMTSVKKTLSIPEWLDEIAKKESINYSQLLQKALIEHLRHSNTLSDYDRRMLNDIDSPTSESGVQ